MNTRRESAPGQTQVPSPGAVNIDHVAHFVPDADAASDALTRLGFTLTPFSVQSHRLQPDGPLVPAGTGNRCVMLERGYLEFLTPLADTPVAQQLRDACGRYVGVHLIAFGTGDALLDHSRLVDQSFDPLAPVALQRPISTPDGEGLARFTVVRVPPGTMAEGRIQFCQHHTPELVWQPRWVDHPNGATGLASVLVCVADVEEAAARFGRFTGVQPVAADSGRVLQTARGTVGFVDRSWVERTLGTTPPALPWIAGYVLQSRDLAATRRFVERAGFEPLPLAMRFAVALPPALGGFVVFAPQS